MAEIFRVQVRGGPRLKKRKEGFKMDMKKDGILSDEELNKVTGGFCDAFLYKKVGNEYIVSKVNMIDRMKDIIPFLKGTISRDAVFNSGEVMHVSASEWKAFVASHKSHDSDANSYGNVFYDMDNLH